MKTVITMVTQCIIKTKILLGFISSYTDWYLLMAKFTNDSNFLVREVWRDRELC